MSKPRGSTRVRLPNGMRILAFSRLEARVVAKQVGAYFLHGIDLQPGAVVVDVGANIGVFALEAFRRCKGAISLFAFEPIPTTFELLQINLAECAVDRMKAFRLGLSNRTGEASFTFFPGASVLSTRHPGSEGDFFEKRVGHRRGLLPRWLRARIVRILVRRLLVPKQADCRLETLSNIIRQEGIDRIDLLKVDVEKAEVEVLEGIEDAHWSRIRQIVVEVHDIEGRVRSIESMLRVRGFGEIIADQEEELKHCDIYNIYARRTKGQAVTI